jgi:hypothetical protein
MYRLAAITVVAALVSTGCSAESLHARDARSEQDAAQGSAATGRHPRGFKQTLGLASVSVGAIAAAVAVVTSFVLIDQKKTLDDNCNAQKQCNADGFAASGTIHATSGWNTGAWIVGIVGLGGGAALLLTNHADTPGSTAITVFPGGLALKSLF